MSVMHQIDAFTKLKQLDGQNLNSSTPTHRQEAFRLAIESTLCLENGSHATFALVESEPLRHLNRREWRPSSTVYRASSPAAFTLLEFTWLLAHQYDIVLNEGFKQYHEENSDAGKRGNFVREFHDPKPEEIAELWDGLGTSITGDTSYGFWVFDVVAILTPLTAESLIRAAQSNRLVKCKVCGKEVAELSSVCSNCGVNLPGLYVQCPNCLSIYTTIEKKGFGVGKATVGGVMFGAVGLVAGMIGSKDTEFVCSACGNRWSLPTPR